MRIAMLALLGLGFTLGVITGCGSSSNGPGGMTNPPAPMPTDSVSGIVNFKGAPLAGVTVTLWMTNDNTVHGTATTDAGGAYKFTGISASGNAAGDYQLWALKPGFAFYPSVGKGGKVIRFDHTGQFQQSGPFGMPMYLTVIDFLATENNSIADANFTAYDGTNPLVTLPATGQASTFSPGDDGALRKGEPWPEQRFSDNADGTVTDNVTGLLWLRNAGCLPPAPWSAALTAANALASGACGLTDGSTAGQWRLPNMVELAGLLDASAANPALMPGHPFTNVAPAVYWTSTSYFGGQAGSLNAWAIRISDGRYINDSVLNAKTSALNQAWAVKGVGTAVSKPQATGLYVPYQAGDDGTLQKGVPLVYPRFIDHANGTVTDAMTGLIWLKLANCVQGDWATASAAVRALANGKCGLTDGSTAGQWRMPNRNEMQSLADRNQNNEADYLDTTFRNPDGSIFQAAVLNGFMPYNFYWTSTTDASDPSQAWTVFSCDFGVYDMPKDDTGYTLAVR
jgi:hypothetical protein